MNRVAFYTLGCKVNQYETEAMAEAFENAGYELVEFEEAADVYVINTCTVTGLSSRKSRQAIRRAKQLNRSAIVAAVGCYPQTAREEVENIPEVDIVAGTADRLRLPEYVEKFRNGEGRISEVGNIMKRHAFEDLKIERYKGRTRAFLKIQEGCSQFCSYCIIPYARGPIRSRPAEDVLNEVRKLSEAGFKEVVLTGIHIASYGRDQGQIGLLELVKLIHGMEGIERIRLGSIEPTMITGEFVTQAAGLEKLCPHYHISLQSGCDETLARMNRKYRTADYKRAVDLLREQIPDVSITTDVMVGFPGETPEEFEKTFEFLEMIGFAKMHVFKYSPRKGTPAATYENQVDGTVKEYRSARVMELSDRCALEFNCRFIGREMPVLYEQAVKDSGGQNEQAVKDSCGQNEQAVKDSGGQNEQAVKDSGGQNEQAVKDSGGQNEQAVKDSGGQNEQAVKDSGGQNNQEAKDSGGLYEGLTPNYIRVLSNADNSILGNIAATRLIRAEKEFIIGGI